MSTLNFTQSTSSGRYRTSAGRRQRHEGEHRNFPKVVTVSGLLTALCLEQEAVDGGGGAGHVGQGDLPEESIDWMSEKLHHHVIRRNDAITDCT